MKSPKNQKNKQEKKVQKPNKYLKYTILLSIVCIICIVIAILCSKKDDNVDPNALTLKGEWIDIMTDSKISFDEHNNLYIFDSAYSYTYNEEKQQIYIEYMGGYTLVLDCVFENGYWKLLDKGDGLTYVPASKRDEIRNQEIARKWENHTKNRTEVLLGQTYTTTDGIEFTITKGEMVNTPELNGSSAVVILYVDCKTEITVKNWPGSALKTPSDNHNDNTYIESNGEGKYIIKFYHNIGGVSILGKAPHDYCILQFEFGGTKYYINALNLELISK